jgi:hypothetical protein
MQNIFAADAKPDEEVVKQVATVLYAVMQLYLMMLTSCISAFNQCLKSCSN